MYLRPLKTSLAALLMASLAACGADAPTPAPESETVAAPELEAPLPVVGPERVILAFGDSLFAGYDLAEDEGYPEQLEDVLRARGINARVIDAGVSGDTTAAGAQRIGFVLDNAGEQGRQISSWIEGTPEPSFWAGLKLSDRKQIEIESWRCGRCGYLESYAPD